MEKEEMPHLRGDDDGRYRSPFARDVHENGLRRNVVVPEVVMDDLKMPDDLAVGRAERDDRVGVHVGAETLAAVMVGACAARRKEDEPARGVDGYHRPHVRGSRASPAVAGPGRTRGIRLPNRNRVPAPPQGAALLLLPP